MIEVIHPGISSSIQDRGRPGFGQYGVPCSGAMDLNSLDLANRIAGNEGGEPAIEFAYKGPQLRFHSSCALSMAGADCQAMINGKPVASFRKLEVTGGDTLSFGKMSRGVYCYIAFEGGLATEEVMGSRSRYEGITSNALLVKGEFLPLNKMTGSQPTGMYSETTELEFKNSIAVRCGPEFNLLSDSAKTDLFNNKFTQGSQSNRMACHFEEQIDGVKTNILTGPVLPGTIQCTPSGNLYVLMRDAQTTGGYPRILQVESESINHLAQVRAGEKIRLQLIGNQQE